MNNKLNLIERQQEAIDSILALGENGRRAMGFRLTFLNKKRRGLAAIYRRYCAAASEMGYTASQISAQWRDIKDMVVLEVASER
jgi:hypothetical protein